MATTPEELIGELHSKAIDDLMGERYKLDQQYKHIPETLARVSKLTGVDETTLIRVSVRSAFSYADLSWVQVLDVLNTFFVTKRTMENPED